MKNYLKQAFKFTKLIFAAVLSFLILVFFFYGIVIFFDEFTDYEEENFSEESEDEPVCNVYGIELRGELATYAYDNDESIMSASEIINLAIEDGENDPEIKAIFLEVDSYGGYPVAGEEVAIALRKAQKPTVAMIREAGVSAAYMAASGADTIFASRFSDVGSIGVSMSYLDKSRQNQSAGLDYVSLSSGIFKDTGTADKPLSLAERELLMRDVDIIHGYFMELVAKNRNLEIADVERMADGSTMLGEMALENGLIDRIGGLPEVKDYLRELIGEDVEICW